jgi:hypothetical protein
MRDGWAPLGRGHYPELFHTGKSSGSHPSIETLLAKINIDMVPCQDSELRKIEIEVLSSLQTSAWPSQARLHSVLTELNRDCDAGEAYARETLGRAIGVIKLREVFHQSHCVSWDGQRRTYAYIFPIGNPDVPNAPDPHNPRSRRL